MSRNTVAILRHGAIELELHADKVAWHALSKTLFVADLHLGKDTTFQRSSLPVPSGSTDQGLERLARHISSCRPDRVVILGDLVHASSSFTDVFRERMACFWETQRRESPSTEWILVEGNHDLRAKREILRWPITIVEPPWSIGRITCVHDPALELDEDALSDTGLVLAGHLHPSFRMPDNGEKLCCFALFGNTLVFPAFNDFTGRRPIDTSNVQTVYVIRDSQLAKIELRALDSRLRRCP